MRQIKDDALQTAARETVALIGCVNAVKLERNPNLNNWWCENWGWLLFSLGERDLTYSEASSLALSWHLWYEHRCHISFCAGSASHALEIYGELHRKLGSETFSQNAILQQSKWVGAMHFMAVTCGEILWRVEWHTQHWLKQKKSCKS